LNGQAITLTGVTISGAGQVVDSASTKGSLTLAGTSAVNGLNAEGVALVIAETANVTLTGTSSVSTIAGEGSLTVQGADDSDQGKATLTLTGDSEFGGILSVGDNATLRLEGVTKDGVKTPAMLTIKNTLWLQSTRAMVETMSEDYSLALITIADGATIIPSTGEYIRANMVIEGGATIDFAKQNGRLRLNAIDLPVTSAEGVVQGVVYLKNLEGNYGEIIKVQKGLPIGLTAANFVLNDATCESNLYIHTRTADGIVAVAKIGSDIRDMSIEEQQAVLNLCHELFYMPITEITNLGVVECFDGTFDNAYGFTSEYYYTDDPTAEPIINICYFVNFGISDITNVRQDNGSLLANVVAQVDPLEPSGTVSFKNGVVVALYVNNQVTPLRTVEIGKDTADYRQVIFEDVPLPNDIGTHELTVRVHSKLVE
jgi:hypothetical protein